MNNTQPLFHLFLLVCLLFTIQFPVLSHSCHDYERNSLLSFKSFLSDPSNRLSTWNQENRNCCNWDGIQCSDDSFHVIALDLRGTNREIHFTNLEIYLTNHLGITQVSRSFTPSTELNGTISPSLFNLTHLQYLDLSWNFFQSSSKINHGFANLKKLTHLDLSNSGLEESISTRLANLSSLSYLDLSCFSVFCLFGVVKTSTNWLRGLVNLKVLRLSGLNLHGVSSKSKNWAEPLSYLSNLRELDLSRCGLSGTYPINDQFLNLSRLSSLKMSSNYNLKYNWNSFSNLTSLSVLGLSQCNLQGSISYLPQLKELYVDNNPILTVDLTWMIQHWPKLHTLSMSGTHVIQYIPSSISNASSLVNLFAPDCSIRGSFPSSIINHSQLKFLDLSRNKITGHLPSSFSNLSHLEVLILTSNNMTGHLPSSFSNLSQLQVLDLSFNNMTGHLPSSFSNHSQLQVLDLSVNNMTGHLPSSFSNLKELRILDLSDNEFQGSIPLNSICKFSSLERLRFNDNNLTGRIPNCINNLQNLVVFNGAGNSIGGYLKGDIPISICNLTNLIRLDLSDNILIGDIPSCLFKLTNLKYIHLSRNNLQGPIPLPPKHVYIFDLSKNNLTGGISMEAGRRLSNARIISLSSNKLSGSIPFSLCSSKVNDVGFGGLESLDLSNNQFSGTIPSSLGNCTSLIFLQLNDNTLSGSFPNFIQRLEDLSFLNLGNNILSGSLPSFIGSLVHLKILSLRSNMFNGSIPKEIVYLQELQILDLSRNNFSGTIPKKMCNLTKLTSSTSGPRINLAMFGMDVQLKMVIKGIMLRFESLYSYNLGIDLSFNILEGNIPEEIGLLKELVSLSLSHNRFSGRIPDSVENMTKLESLDLSFNILSGEIPHPLTLLDSLGYLNLSYNNLSGRVPGGLHFDTLSGDNGSAYIGNSLLCGVPTQKPCEGDLVPSGSTDVPTSTVNDEDGDEDEDEDAKEKVLFYGVVILGYGVGFWGLFFVLLIRKEKWWFGYWRVVDTVAVKLVRCLS